MQLNIIRPPVLLFLSMFYCIASNAQQLTDKGIEMYSAQLKDKLKPTSLHYWLDIRPEEKIKPEDFLKDYKTDLRLSANDNFKLLREVKDNDGNTHNRFQQYYKCLRVEGAESVVHELNGFVKSVNGKWASEMDKDTKPSLNEMQSLNLALNNIKSKDYLWQHRDADKYEKLIKEKNITLQPKGELVFCRINNNGDFDPVNLTLAWKFTLLVLPMSESATIYIDAAKGNVLNKIPVNLNCTIGNGATTWYGTRSFSTSWLGWPDNTFHLDVDEAGCSGYTNIISRRGDPIVPYNYGDADNSWYDADGVNGYNMRAGVTTHWSLINSYNYYRYVLGRLSYDGANAGLDAYSEINGGSWLSDQNNAAWNSTFHILHFGSGSLPGATDDWNCIDIVGHEMTHGVVQYAAGLNYSYESGALNESFADIFGEMIDGYATGTIDWLMGADRGGALRSFSNPNSLSQPDTYTGAYWFTGSDDNGGVHYNSGVQNYWFYLLSLGGSGTNDLGRAYSVSGLGTSVAAAIAYKNLEMYMISSSSYNDAREGAIRAAEDLYGSCSNQVIQTARAWYAVGVGYDQYVYDYSLCGTYSGTTINLWKTPDALNVGQSCNVSFSSTGSGSKAIMSGTSITFYPGVTASPNFSAYLNTCAVAAYSLTAITQPQTESIVANSSSENLLAKKNNVVQNTISVYPNPAASYIGIRSANAINKSSCFITDVAGKRFACNFTNANTVDVTRLTAGVYFIYVMDGAKAIAIKFIKL